MDPDPAFYLNADPDPGRQTNVEPCCPDPYPSHILKSQKVEFFYIKNTGILEVDDMILGQKNRTKLGSSKETRFIC